MATFTDVLQARFDFILDSGTLAKFDILQDKFMMIQSAASNITGLRNMQNELRDVGLTATKSGAFQDLLTGKFVSTSEVLNRVTEGVSSYKTMIDDVTPSMKKMGARFTDVDNIVKQTGGSFLSMNAQIGILMGTLFGGMTLQRWGNSILRFVLPPMEQLQGYTSEGTRGVMAMRASFEFLKFSMFETFTQTPLFRSFVELIIQAVNWLSELVSKHPTLTAIAATFGALLATVGTLLMLFGGAFQFVMLYDLANQSRKAAEKVGLLTAAGLGLRAAFFAIFTPMGVVITLLTLLAAGIVAAYIEFPELQQRGDKALSSISTGVAGLVASFFELFSIEVDTTDALFLLGTTFDVVFQIATRGANAILHGLTQIVDLIKLAGYFAALGLATIAGNTNQADLISSDIDEILAESAKKQKDFQKQDEERANSIAIAREGMLEGRDAALELERALAGGTEQIINMSATQSLVTDAIKTTTEEIENSYDSAFDFGTIMAENAKLVSDSMSETQQTIFDALSDETSGAFPTASDKAITLGNNVQNEIINVWESWSPSEKTLIINVERRGDGSGPDFDMEGSSSLG
jgi:hypothetical protein